jgi:hypothetical protein
MIKRTSLTILLIFAQPSSPPWTGTIICNALPSLAGTGPTTWPSTPSTLATAAASAAAFIQSAAVIPASRSYTTTAGSVSLGWNRSCPLSTLVTSAWAGSQADLSFSCAPSSLPTNGSVAAITAAQHAITIHAVRRPQGNAAILFT